MSSPIDFWFSIGSTYTYLSVMRIDALAEQISTALPQIQGKAVKAMATMGTGRAPGLEDLPTAAEQGYPARERF